MLKFFAFILHLVFLGLCYLPFANFIIPPSIFPYFQYTAILWPALMAIHIVGLVLWLLSKNFVPLFFILLLSLGLYTLLNNTVRFQSEKEGETNSLKAITFNIHYLNDTRADSLNALIKKEQPDFVFFQEFRKGELDSLSYFQENGFEIAEYPYIAIASKYPILEEGEILDQTTNGHICYADVASRTDTLRLISTYLEPFYAVPELLQSTERKQFKENSKRLKYLFERAFEIHEDQLKQMRPFVRNVEYPVIIGADLNAVPNSFEYFKMTNYLSLIDAFKAAGGRGLGSTFNDLSIPARIDYIFTSKDFEILNAKVLREKLSDHYPLVSQLKLKKD